MNSSENEQTRNVVDFGPFRLFAAERRLERDGLVMKLGSRSLDILLTLVARAPELVTKSELLTKVWAGITVSDGSLRLAVSELRNVLDDGKTDSQYVMNVPSRGYCFVAPLRSPDRSENPASTSKTNLPQPVMSIIAREAELTALQACLDENRLVTIVGPGGVGKTRLAVELGWQALEDFTAGVWLVDLAPAGDPGALASATAAALGISLPASGNAAEIIAAALGGQPRLLILDNCEHLVAAAACLVQRLLEKVQGLKILVTSQQPLGLAEKLYYLQPLAVPSANATDIGSFGAVAFFVHRAQIGNRLFALDATNQGGISEICRRLDGLPLALEMAAARLHLLGVEALQTGLDERLKMLRGPAHRARHVSLLAMLEWSHGLLDPADQVLFRRLAIFPASFTLDAVVAVSGQVETGAPAADRWDILDGIGRLVDRSLVTIEGREPVRYRLLETMRLFAARQLRSAGERAGVEEFHAHHVMAVFDIAAREWETTPDLEWIARYRFEIDNLRAALLWALADPQRSNVALAIGGSGAILFSGLSLLAAGSSFLDQVILLIKDEIPSDRAARVFHQAARLRLHAQDPGGLPYAERAAALYRQLNNRYGLGAALGIAGFCHAVQQRADVGLALLHEARDLLADSNLRKQKLCVLNDLGIASIVLGDFGAARGYFSEALSLAQAVKALTELSIMINLSVAEHAAGDPVRAEATARKAVQAARNSPRPRDLETSAANLATYLLAQNKFEEARPFAEEALPRAGGVDPPSIQTIQCWARLAAFEGRASESARLLGFALAERERKKMPEHRKDRVLDDEVDRRLQALLHPAKLQKLKDEGMHWTIAEARQLILTLLLPQQQQKTP